MGDPVWSSRVRHDPVRVVVLLWGGYRVESEPRWHVNGLSNESVVLFDDTSEVRKGSLNTGSHCPNPEQQFTWFWVEFIEGDFGPGEGQYAGAAFATIELAATRLEDAGWEVGRRQLRGGMTVESGELSALHLTAYRDGDYLRLIIGSAAAENSAVRADVYADECMAEENSFRLTGAGAVDEFGPDR